MNKFFQVHDLYGIVGAMLVLILVYLVLEHWVGAQAVLNTTMNDTNNIFKTLQGR